VKVYLAGKIWSNDWRHDIFKGLRNHQYDNIYDDPYFKRDAPLVVDGHTYSGPYFLSDDHSFFHGDGSHGRGLHLDENVMAPDWEIERQQYVVQKCFQWIKESDAMFVWLSADDCYGTIAEIGYAKSLGKRIFIGVDEKEKSKGYVNDMWFALECAEEVVYTQTAVEAWQIFTKQKQKTQVEKPTKAQLDLVLRLCKQKGKVLATDVVIPSKDEVGKVIAYLQKGKFEDEVEHYFKTLTKKQQTQYSLYEPKYKTTQVIEMVKEKIGDPNFKLTIPAHAKLVKEYNAKKKKRFSETTEYDNKYSGFGTTETTLYSQFWINHLVHVLQSTMSPERTFDSFPKPIRDGFKSSVKSCLLKQVTETSPHLLKQDFVDDIFLSGVIGHLKERAKHHATRWSHYITDYDQVPLKELVLAQIEKIRKEGNKKEDINAYNAIVEKYHLKGEYAKIPDDPILFHHQSKNIYKDMFE